MEQRRRLSQYKIEELSEDSYNSNDPDSPFFVAKDYEGISSS